MKKDSFPMDEKEAIARCLQGDPEAFQFIIDNYSQPMMVLALSLLRNRQDAEDVCQEAFLQAFCYLNRYDEKQSFRQWLLTILYRRIIDFKRKHSRWINFLKHFRENFLQTSSALAKKNEPQTNFEAKEKTNHFFSFLENLTPKERAVLTLWTAEGLTSQEIAKIIGCHPSTVRVYLYLSRKKVKAWLEEKK